MAGKLKKIWKNKFKIFEGLYNSWFPTNFVEKIAAHRLAICQTNECGFYDEKGISEAAVVPGAESCGQCGCKLSLKIRSLSSECALQNIGKLPLWEEEMTEKEEAAWRKKTGLKNEG